MKILSAPDIPFYKLLVIFVSYILYKPCFFQVKDYCCAYMQTKKRGHCRHCFLLSKNPPPYQGGIRGGLDETDNCYFLSLKVTLRTLPRNSRQINLAAFIFFAVGEWGGVKEKCALSTTSPKISNGLVPIKDLVLFIPTLYLPLFSIWEIFANNLSPHFEIFAPLLIKFSKIARVISM